MNCQKCPARWTSLQLDEILQKCCEISAAAPEPLTYPLRCANIMEFLWNSLIFARRGFRGESVKSAAERTLAVFKEFPASQRRKNTLIRTSARSAAPRRGRRKIHRISKPSKTRVDREHRILMESHPICTSQGVGQGILDATTIPQGFCDI